MDAPASNRIHLPVQREPAAAVREVLLVRDDRRPAVWIPPLHATGWRVTAVHEASAASRLLETRRFDAGLVELAGGSGDLVREAGPVSAALREHGRIPWILLVAPELLGHAEVRHAIARHCFDFHRLPVEVARLAAVLGHACGMHGLRAGAQPAAAAPAPSAELIGDSEPMHRVRCVLAKAARSDVPVTLTGATGTGKEVAARMLHGLSQRRDRPFVVVNCAALPPTLIQAELFGYERGAFTGAHVRKTGRLEAAAGGTVFLDEIGELPAALQANLLRFLQDGTVERLGGTRTLRLDVRIVAATHVDLEAAVEDGRFREDLYYRTNVLPIRLPALRERGRDAEQLAHFFLEQLAREEDLAARALTQDALAAIRRHPWPGNVRELRNRIHRAMVLCDGRWIRPSDLELGSVGHDPERRPLTLAQARAEAERSAIQACLRQTDDSVSRAAHRLGVSRVTLYRLMQKHDIAPESPPGPRCSE